MESDLFVNMQKKKKSSICFVRKSDFIIQDLESFGYSCIAPPPPLGGEAPFTKTEDLPRRHESVFEVSKASKLRNAD